MHVNGGSAINHLSKGRVPAPGREYPSEGLD